MQASPRRVSPRRALAMEEKRKRDVLHKMKIRQFNDQLKALVTEFNVLAQLNAAIGQVPKGAYLAYPNPAQPDPTLQGHIIPFRRSDMKSANKKFSNAIIALKTLFRLAIKKTREPVRPESFSGTYTPVYAAEALLAFFTIDGGRFGPLHPVEAVRTQQGGESLMASLEMVTQGYLLRNTVTMLFYIYAHANDLQSTINAQFAKSDDIMDAAFAGEIPAAFFAYRNDDDKPEKMRMDRAIAQGFIDRPLNTYEVVKFSHPDFNTLRNTDIARLNDKPGEEPTDITGLPNDPNTYFPTFYFQNIGAANYWSRAALEKDETLAATAAALARADVRAAMLREHNLVKEVSSEWKALLEPGRKVQRDARKKIQDQNKKARKARAQGGLI